MFIFNFSPLSRHTVRLHFPASFAVRWGHITKLQSMELGEVNICHFQACSIKTSGTPFYIRFYPLICIIEKTLKTYKVEAKDRAEAPKSSFDVKPPRGRGTPDEEYLHWIVA